MSLKKNKFHVHPVENFSEMDKKTDFWTNFGPIRVKKGHKNMAPGVGHNLHTPEIPPIYLKKTSFNVTQ